MDLDELPEVNDLEVAALAAMAYPFTTVTAMSDSDETSSGEDSSEETDSSADVDMQPQELDSTSQAEQSLQKEPGIDVELTVQEDESVVCDLIVRVPCIGQELAESSDSDDESEVFDADQLRSIIDAMDDPDGDAEDSKREQDAGLPAAEPMDVVITAEDSMLPIGSVTSVLGSMIIIQGIPNGTTVDEGSVVCLGPDQPLGRIQEVFGPVHAPLYALAYAGSPPVPEELVPGACVLAVERLSVMMAPDQLHKPEVRAHVQENDEDDPDVEFSDDEKEAEYRRAQQTQLSAPPGKAQSNGRHSGPHHRDGRSSHRGRNSSRGRSSQRRPSQGRGRMQDSWQTAQAMDIQPSSTWPQPQAQYTASQQYDSQYAQYPTRGGQLHAEAQLSAQPGSAGQTHFQGSGNYDLTQAWPPYGQQPPRPAWDMHSHYQQPQQLQFPQPQQFQLPQLGPRPPPGHPGAMRQYQQ